MFWIMARFYHRILKGAWRIWIRLANMPRPLACLSRRPRPGLLARPPVRPGAPAWRALRPERPRLAPSVNLRRKFLGNMTERRVDW